MVHLAEGLGAAEKRAEEEKTGGFFRVKTYKFKDDQTPAHLRFVTNQTISFGFHSGIPTKKKPKEISGSWPDMMFQICRNDKAFRNRDPQNANVLLDGFEADADGIPYGDCWSHAHMKGKKDPTYGHDKSQARMQTFGLAVEREPVYDKDEEIIGYRDCTEEYKHTDPDGESAIITIPRLVLIQQTYSNFWAPLAASIIGKKKDLTKKDLTITRKGNDYGFAPADLDPEHVPGTPSFQVYADAQELLGYSLLGQLLKWASPDWQARWFDPEKTPKDGYGRKDDDEDGEEEAAAESGDKVDEAAVSSVRERLMAARK